MIENKEQEKKVEYLELIYDLIFVYIVGRNNSILHHVEGGFFTLESFLLYIFCTLAVIQIWSFSSMYINLHGRNSIRDHIFLFINMYLLYHMANGIGPDWRENFYEFSIAWALILVNIAVQYFLEIRNQKDMPGANIVLKQQGFIILGEVVLILVHILVFYLTGVSIAYVPVLFGIIISFVTGSIFTMFPVDFPHLSERAMLYVVFTFGEMIIVMASYFEGGFNSNTLFFSIAGFLIVVGLFLSYEMLYNRIVDREMTTNGLTYMLVHVFLILSLNNISIALEFMADEKVDVLPKIVFLTVSIILYFVCIFALGIYSKKKCAFNTRFILGVAALTLAFAILMIVLREYMYVNIIITVLYVGSIFLILYRRSSLVK